MGAGGDFVSCAVVLGTAAAVNVNQSIE